MNRYGLVKKVQRRIGSALLLALFAAANLTIIARGHATLLRSDPVDGALLDESPRLVRLWFDEPVAAQFSSAQLLDARGQPIAGTSLRDDQSDPALMIITLPELPPGVYSILWKVFSEADGHYSQGVFVFGVGEGTTIGAGPVAHAPAPAPPLPEVILRWFNFTLLAGLVGGIAILQFVLSPVARSSREDLTLVTALDNAWRQVLGLIVWCTIFALFVGFGLLAWQALSLMRTLPQGPSFLEVSWQVLSRTRWGLLWLVRQSVLLLMSGLVIYLARKSREQAEERAGSLSHAIHHTGAGQKFIWLLASVLGLALATVQSLSGHASGLSPETSLAVLADTVHILAASFWVGGLVALVFGLIPQLLRRDQNFSALARLGWGPFSRIAALSVGLLLATGLYNTARQVASPDALLTSLYGQALSGKLGLLLLMGLLGGLNASLLHPDLAAPLARLLRKPTGWTPFSLHSLPKLVLVEAALGILIYLATSFVTASPAPRGSEFTIVPGQVPSALSQSVGDLVITLSAKPNRPGQNVFTVFASSIRRPPPAEISRVILRFTSLEQESGHESAVMEEVEPGRYLLGGSQLSLAGAWQVDVVVRRLGLEDRTARFYWIVAPLGEARPVLISKYAWETPLTFAAAGTLLGVILVAYVFWNRRSKFTSQVQNEGRPDVSGGNSHHERNVISLRITVIDPDHGDLSIVQNPRRIER